MRGTVVRRCGTATFSAISEERGSDRRTWPARYRIGVGGRRARYAAGHEERIRFHAWLQWLADEQLAAAAAVGPRLMTDLPVGFDPGGFDAWEWQGLLAEGVSI